MPTAQIGQLLIQSGYITEEQFNQALQVQQESPNLEIGQILCQLNFLKIEDLNSVLDYNGLRKKLGEILVKEGALDEQKLTRALEIAQKEKIPLGQALIKMRVLDEEQLARAIAKQYDLPYMSLQNFKVPSDLSRFLNSQYATRHRLVPVKLEDNILTIAIAFPLQHAELEQLKVAGKHGIKLVVSPESQIVLAQQKLFRKEGSFSFVDDLSLSEDSDKQMERSKYVHDLITVDVERLVKLIFSTGIKHKASDIHLESTENGMEVRYRLDGMLQTLDLGSAVPLINLNARQIVSKVKIMCDMDIAERRRPQDSSFKLKVERGDALRTVDFRVSTVPTQYGENVVIRVLDKRNDVLTLTSLGYNPQYTEELLDALEKPTGIFLVTGPTGSGKSTTLYALLGHLNRPEVKTLTVEDPIEYSINGITQTEVNDQIGNTFSRLLRAFLRQDPDNIMIGEIRDAETANIAIKAALTGHTVLSTLHTNDATSAVTRLLDMGVEPTLLLATLRGVLAQRLVRCNCKECLEPYSPSELAEREFTPILSEYEGIFYHGIGCAACNFTGYKGRLPIAELWLPLHEELMIITNLSQGKNLREKVFGGNKRINMIQDGLRLVKEGLTTLEELIRVVPSEQFDEWRGHYLLNESNRSTIETGGERNE